MHATSCKNFSHHNIDQYFEYVLWDLGYVDTEMFIMRLIQGHEIGVGISQEVIEA